MYLQFRADWYQYMAAVEADESAQKKGFIKISYHNGCREVDPKFLDSFEKRRMLSDAIPLRLVGAHFCYDTSTLRSMALFVQNAVSKEHRLRFRAHFGKLQNVGYGLLVLLFFDRSAISQIDFFFALTMFHYQVLIWSVNTS